MLQKNYISVKEADALLIMTDKVVQNEYIYDKEPPIMVDPQMWRTGFLYTALYFKIQNILDIIGLHDKMVNFILYNCILYRCINNNNYSIPDLYTF